MLFVGAGTVHGNNRALTTRMCAVQGVVSKDSILLKNHIFKMLCWMSARSFCTILGIDESTEV